MRTRKTLSILLALAILLSCIGWTPTQAEEATKETSTGAVTENIQTQSPDEGSNILQYVDEEKFHSRDHVARLREEERHDTYVFLNRDGTKTVYYMGRDVKYTDHNGQIREKDTTLVRGEGGYGMRDNDVLLHLPDEAGSGIRLSHGERGVRLIPQGGSGSATLADNSITYQNYFGRGIHLRYTPMLSGVKEDIILLKYTGQNSFTFTLETGGLTLFASEGQYYLAESEGAEAAFYLGEIVVYDAMGKPDLGTMTVETITAGQSYRLTVSADADFLTDPETRYPVTIDPSITFSFAENGTGYMIDAPVFENYPTQNFGNYNYNHMGYVDATFGQAVTAVRLTGLLADEDYAQISADQITEVTFHIRDAGTSYSVVNIHALNSTWTETEITWNNIGTWGTTIYDSESMGGGFWDTFDITALAKEWKNGTQSGACGFVMVSADSTKKTSTFSSEHPTTDSRPYVEVTYRSTISLNLGTADVDEGAEIELEAYTVPEDQTVTWTSDNPSVATVENGVVTGVKCGTATITATCDDVIAPASCTVYVTVPDGVYYIQNLNSEIYMHVPCGDLSESSEVQQNDLYDSDLYAETELIRQMWKIKHLGSGCYSIRTMLNPTMGLCANSNGDAFVRNVGTNDSILLVGDAQWNIIHHSGGFSFRNAIYPKNREGNYIYLQIENNSEAIGTSIELAPYSNTGSCSWNLSQIENPPSGTGLLNVETGNFIDFSPNIVVAPNEKWTFERLNAIAVSYSGSSISQSLMWETRNETVATVNSSGEITGIAEGTTLIKGMSSVTGKWISITVRVLPVANGTYLIKNKENNCFVHMEDFTSGGDDYETYQATYGEIDCKAWTITHLGDGYYSIQSATITSHYLGVLEDSSALNAQIGSVKTNGVLTAGTKWKIVTTSSGALKFIPQTGQSSDYVLAVSTYNEVDKAPLIQGAYVPNYSYKDEWLIAEAIAFSDYRFPSATVTVQVSNDPLTMSDEWYPLIVAAVDSWNSAGIGITINLTTETAPIFLQVTNMEPEDIDVNANNSYCGVLIPITYTDSYMKFLKTAQIYIFSTKYENKSDNAKQQAIAHELGHIFGLEDNPDGDKNRSIMNYLCHDNYFVPQEFDLYNVKFIMNID